MGRARPWGERLPVRRGAPKIYIVQRGAWFNRIRGEPHRQDRRHEDRDPDRDARHSWDDRLSTFRTGAGDVSIRLYPDANGTVGRIEVLPARPARTLSRGSTGCPARRGGRFAAGHPANSSAASRARPRLVRQTFSAQQVGRQCPASPAKHQACNGGRICGDPISPVSRTGPTANRQNQPNRPGQPNSPGSGRQGPRQSTAAARRAGATQSGGAAEHARSTEPAGGTEHARTGKPTERPQSAGTPQSGRAIKPGGSANAARATRPARTTNPAGSAEPARPAGAAGSTKPAPTAKPATSNAVAGTCAATAGATTEAE
jgi:hypothetical protein